MIREDATVVDRKNVPEPEQAREPDQSWPRKVRTTQEPDREYEVGPAEYADLLHLGLIKGE